MLSILLSVFWWYGVISMASIGAMALMIIYDICVYGSWYIVNDNVKDPDG